jgi:hypothetical protein
MRKRVKVTSGSAAIAAAAVIPDPEAEQAPPHEVAGELPSSYPNPPGTMPWGQVIDDVIQIDVVGTYQRLRDDLSLGEDAHAYGELAAALDRADRNFHSAVLLARAAKLEQEKIDRQVEGRLEILRTTARQELEQEKADGKRSKAPTLEEVADRCRASWPDEWEALNRNKDEIHAARASCEGLQSAWSSRAQSLRKLIERYGGA